MSDLTEKRCQPCEGNVPPMTRAEALALMPRLNPAWQMSEDATKLRREFRFVDFYRTMSFLNVVAHVANIEDHHPDVEVGYNYCNVTFSTHAIKGLSENDFICAAKVDRITLA